MSFLEMCVGKKLWHSILSNIRDTNAHFDAKVERAHSFCIILNVPTEVNFTGKSVLFE